MNRCEIYLLLMILKFNLISYSASQKTTKSYLVLRFKSETGDNSTKGYTIQIPGEPIEECATGELTKEIRERLKNGDLKLFENWVEFGIKPFQILNVP